MMAFEDDGEPGGSMWAAGDTRAVVRRVWYAMPAVGVAMVVAALVVGTTRDAIGVTVGVVLAAVNFRFLETSLRSLLGAGHERTPPGTTLMFLVRWALVAIFGYVAYRTGHASGGGIIAGLFAPAVAIMLEAGYQLGAALARGGD